MSYVLRRKNSGDFLGGPGEWTNQMERALHFNSGLNLVQYVERARVREPQDGLEVLLVSPTDQILTETAIDGSRAQSVTP